MADTIQVEVKRPWQSTTLWMNLIIAVLAIAFPAGHDFVTSHPEIATALVTGLNFINRFRTEDKVAIKQ